jgi:hypothetical protein
MQFSYPHSVLTCYIPLTTGDAWTSVCSFRMTLYRQRVSLDYCHRPQDVRFAYFQKCEGIVVKDDEAKNVPFLITVFSPWDKLILGYRN